MEMKLYDATIRNCLALLSAARPTELNAADGDWRDMSDRSMILRGDMAYELGGGQLPAVGGTIVTADESLVPSDGLFLIGKDLPELTADSPYARVALVRVRETEIGEGEALYRLIRDLEYTRYHFYPEGFMLRASAANGRESVRVGREALAKGLTFSKTGSRMITAFHTHKAVEAARLYYVTQPEFDYETLAGYVKETESITRTIDHILKTVMTDCAACSLKKVCDEVEGLRELHFLKN